MQTTEQRAEFFAAYKAMVEIREYRKMEMLAIIRGEKVAEQSHLYAQAVKLMTAHKRFMDAGKPFIGYGPQLI